MRQTTYKGLYKKLIALVALSVLLLLSACVEQAKIELGPPKLKGLSLFTVSPGVPRITGSVEEPAQLKLYSSANCSGTSIASISSVGGPFTITGSTLGEGSYNLSVSASNSKGFSCSQDVLLFSVDNTPPTISLGSPSASLVRSASPAVNFTVTYSGASTINLSSGNISLNTTGTATCPTVTVTNGTTSTPTVGLSGCTGNGTVGFTIAAGTASDPAGNTALASAASATFTVDNTGIISASFNPITGIFNAIPSTVAISFPETINGPSITPADFSVTGTCGTLPTLAVTSTIGSTANISLTGAVCSVGQDTAVTLNLIGVADAAGNSGSGSSSVTYTFDNVGPTSASFNPATSSVSSIPSTIIVTFNESILAGSVSSGDFTISGTCTVLPSATLTSVSGAVATVSLAGASCSLNQTVILTANLTGITDLAGNAGSGTGSATYTFDNVGPAASTISPVTASVSSIPTSVAATFGENVLSSSVTASDLIRSGTCSTPPTVSLTSVVGGTLTFGLSGATCLLGETVIVSIAGSSISDAAGNPGTGLLSSTYTFDNVGPVAMNVSPTSATVNAPPTSVTVNFNESVLSSSVAAADLVASGTCTTLPTISLSSVTASSAVFGLTGAVCSTGQTLVVSLAGSSVTDAAANAGSSSASSTFTVDSVGPSPSSLSPVAANFNTMPTTVTVSFDESVLASSVAASDLTISGTCTALPTASVSSVSGSNVTLALSAPTCTNGQTVIVTMAGSSVNDLYGNAGSGSQSATYTKDTTGPTVASFSPATSTVISTPTSVSVNFNEALSSASVGLADFAVTGTCNILPSASLTTVSGQLVVLGLSGAVCAHGQTSVVTVTAAGINDTAGNAGSGTPSVTYTVDSVGPTVSTFTPNIGVPPASVSIAFSETLNAATVAATDFTITGTCGTLPTRTIGGVSGSTVTLNLTGASCLAGQTVIVGINAANVTDTVGNAGSGTSSVTFTQ